MLKQSIGKAEFQAQSVGSCFPKDCTAFGICAFGVQASRQQNVVGLVSLGVEGVTGHGGILIFPGKE